MTRCESLRINAIILLLELIDGHGMEFPDATARVQLRLKLSGTELQQLKDDYDDLGPEPSW